MTLKREEEVVPQMRLCSAALITQRWSRVLINTSENKTAVKVHLIHCLWPLRWLRDSPTKQAVRQRQDKGGCWWNEAEQHNIYRLLSQRWLFAFQSHSFGVFWWHHWSYFCVSTVIRKNSEEITRNMMTNLHLWLFWTSLCCVLYHIWNLLFSYQQPETDHYNCNVENKGMKFKWP